MELDQLDQGRARRLILILILIYAIDLDVDVDVDVDLDLESRGQLLVCLILKTPKNSMKIC